MNFFKISLLFFCFLFTQGCQNVLGPSEVAPDFKGGVKFSYTDSIISTSENLIATSSSLIISLTVLDTNKRPYAFNDLNPEIFISQGSGKGTFGNVESLGNGVYQVIFTATEASIDPVKFGARLQGNPISNLSQAVTIIASTGLTISNIQGSYANIITQNAFPLTGTCSEDGRVVSISGDVSSSNTICSGGYFSETLDVSSLSDGAFYVTVNHADVDGNLATVTKTFIKDTVIANTTITTQPALVTRSTTANFVFAGVESDIQFFKCRLGSAPFAVCTSPFLLTGVGAGSQTFEVLAVDLAGNPGPTVSYSWINDFTGPTVSLGSQPNSITNVTGANFSWTASDTGGGSVASFECSQDGVSYIACSTPLSLSSLAPGNRSFSVRAIDTVGNIGSPETKTWIIDQASPTVSILTKPNSFTSSSNASFAFSAVDTGGGSVSSYECSYDGGSYSSCSSPVTLTSLTPGPHSFSIRATDSASNTGSAVSYSWTIDQTLPTATITSQPNPITNDLTATFFFTGSDTGGGVISSYQCSLNSAAYVPCTSPQFFSSLSAGAQSFSVRAFDSAGNLSLADSYSWTIDTTPPTVTIGQFPASTTYSDAATFGWTSADTGGGSVASFECQIDSAPYFACSSTQGYTSLSNGSHVFSVRSIDTAGNIGPAATKTWTVDTSSLLVSIDSGPPSITNQTNPNFVFSASAGSGAASFECQMDSGGYSACISPKSYSGLSAGSHIFYVRPIDAGGVPGIASTNSFTVDTSPPIVTIATHPTILDNSASALFTFAASDSGGGSVASFECRLDSSGYSPCTSPKAFSGLTEGLHTVYVRALDTAGNTGTASSFTWTTDLTGPSVTISASPSSITNSSTANFIFSGTDTGGGSVNRLECSLDGATYATCTSPQSISSLSVGSHNFSIRAVDTVGNIGTVTTNIWTIDQANPTALISSGPAVVTKQTTANFNFSGSDTGGGTIAGYECKVDVEAYAACVSPKSIVGLTQGSYTFYVRPIDTAGNYGSAVSSSWTVDTTGPTVSIVSAPSSLVNSTTANFSFNATDTGGGVVSSFECKLDAAPYVACANPQSFVGLAAGSHTLLVRSIDSADNAGTVASHSWVIDTTPPVLNLSAPLGGASVYYAKNATVPISWTATDTNFAATPIDLFYSIDGGTTWTSMVSARANSGSYSWVLPSSINSTNVKVKITATDLANNATSVQSNTNFTVDSFSPTFTNGMMSINSNATNTTNNNIQVSLQATDSLTNVQFFCLKFNNSSTPSSSDSCWRSVQANPPNLTPSLTLNLSNYFYQIGLISGTYTIYAFARDIAGNISTISNSGAGTAGQDSASIIYTSTPPPTVTSVYGTFTATPTNPPTSSDLTIAAGSTVHIQWNASDAVGIPNGGISLAYSSDGNTYIPIVSGLNNGSNSGCAVPGNGATGCYTWTNGSPLNTSYRLRVTATNSSGFVTHSLSTVINALPIQIIAGNTNTGVGGSASSAVFNDGSLVVHPNGTIYYLISGTGNGTGLMKVDPITGLYESYIRATGTRTGDGGPATSATLDNASRLLLDYQNRLLIWDNTRIRMVDLNLSTPTIQTIIGGGVDDFSDNIVGTAVRLHSPGFNSGTTFHALPNGDLLFTNTVIYGLVPTAFKLRRWNSTTGLVDSPYGQLNGTGTPALPGQNLADCKAQRVLPVLDPTTFALSQILIYQTSSFDQVNCFTSSNQYSDTLYDAFTGNKIATTSVGFDARNAFIIGRDGNNYFSGQNRIRRWNRTTNTWDLMAGSGAAGSCANGTAALSCPMIPGSIFVSTQGSVYFTESGRIRTIDPDGNIQTIMGQGFSQGNGVLALNARIGVPNGIGQTGINKYVVSDTQGVSLREFTIAGNIQTIAGTGVSGNPATTGLATSSTINATSSSSMVTDPITGDVYISNSFQVLRLRRSTNMFQLFAGNGATDYFSPSAIGLLGTQLRYPGGGNIYVYGFDGSNIVVGKERAVSNITQDSILHLISTSTNVVSHLVGMQATVVPNYSQCLDSNPTWNCNLPSVGSGGSPFRMAWDSFNLRWLYANNIAAGTLRSFTNSGLVGTPYAAIASGMLNYTFVVSATYPTGMLFYCRSSDGRLYKHNGVTATPLTWTITGMRCGGSQGLVYDSNRNSLIFTFGENGLSGIAEFINP